MNKAIANILKQALAGAPYVKKISGLVAVYEYEDTSYDDEGINKLTTIKRIPVSQDLTIEECYSSDLVPDKSKKSVIYFEDNGVRTLLKVGDYFKYQAKLRLVAWINTKWFVNSTTFLSSIIMNDIIKRFSALPFNNGNFLKLVVTVDSIPKQDKAIFSAYTYDQFNSGYLLPPFEFFAIDLSVEFMMHSSCVDDLIIKTDLVFENEQNCT